MSTGKKLPMLFITALFFISVWISNPFAIPLKFKIGSFNVNIVIPPEKINLNFGPLRINWDFKTKLGLDLSGGTHLVMEADMTPVEPQNRKAALDSAQAVIERRINFFGVAEPLIQTAVVGNSYRIIAEIPGVKDSGSAIKLIGSTAKLNFKELKNEIATKAAVKTDSPAASPAGLSFADIVSPESWSETGITGSDLKSAEVVFSQSQSGEPAVLLHFSDKGREKFAKTAQKNAGLPVGIFLDEEIISFPRIAPELARGVLNDPIITGLGSVENAKKLSIQINAGALPTSIKIIEQRTVGATLGSTALKRSLAAGLIGFLVIAVFMLYSYGRRGFAAIMALFIYIFAVYALFKIIPVTLTLAGIAGFILSVGMAVDANILIFERMKEEERWGRNTSSALDLGFQRAFPSIRDSNVSSLITCAILYWFGTGQVRGFALTLAIGIMVSLFTAITVTKTLLRVIYRV